MKKILIVSLLVFISGCSHVTWSASVGGVGVYPIYTDVSTFPAKQPAPDLNCNDEKSVMRWLTYHQFDPTKKTPPCN